LVDSRCLLPERRRKALTFGLAGPAGVAAPVASYITTKGNGAGQGQRRGSSKAQLPAGAGGLRGDQGPSDSTAFRVSSRTAGRQALIQHQFDQRLADWAGIMPPGPRASNAVCLSSLLGIEPPAREARPFPHPEKSRLVVSARASRGWALACREEGPLGFSPPSKSAAGGIPQPSSLG